MDAVEVEVEAGAEGASVAAAAAAAALVEVVLTTAAAAVDDVAAAAGVVVAAATVAATTDVGSAAEGGVALADALMRGSSMRAESKRTYNSAYTAVTVTVTATREQSAPAATEIHSCQ